jgi:Protein of unknown function (DUF3800)
MYICYLDEAGCTGALPDAASSIQPVFVIAGLSFPADRIDSLTHGWIDIKKRFYPGMLRATAAYHDWMPIEVKGAQLRKQARSTSRNDRRFAYGVIGEALKLIDSHGGRLIGKVFIKAIGGVFDGSAVYTSTVQSVCTTFQQLLEQRKSNGWVIADSRNKPKNANVAHSIFTQRFRAGGSPYGRLIELPTFGHSDNHAGLQLADVVCSALLFPIAAQVCSSAHLTDHTHCHPQYLNLISRYGPLLKDLQFRYENTSDGRWYGGVSMADPVNHFNARVLFS